MVDLNLSQFTDPNILSGVSSALGSAGIDAGTVLNAKTAFSLLPDSAQGAVGDVLDSYNAIPSNVRAAGGDLIAGVMHGNVSISSMMPLISMGLLAVPGVGAPAAAILAAATPLIGAVANLLDGEHHVSTDACKWIVKGTANPDPSWLGGGSMTMPMSDDDMHKFGYTAESFGCFSKIRPAGPTSSDWVKFSDYVHKNQKSMGNGMSLTLGAFPDWDVIVHNIRDMANFGNKHYQAKSEDGRIWRAIAPGEKGEYFGGHAGPGGFYGTFQVSSLWKAPLAVREFAALYFYMWQANAEMAINGHKFGSDKDVLNGAIQAWNMHHQGGPTVTIPLGRGWFVESLLKGDIDGEEKTPIVLPTGLKEAKKRTIAFHLGKPVPHPARIVPPRPVALHLGTGVKVSTGEPAKPSLPDRLLPYAPAAAGTALWPVLGPFAPLVGVGATAVWKWRTRRASR